MAFGLDTSDIDNGVINTVDPDARVRHPLGLATAGNASLMTQELRHTL